MPLTLSKSKVYYILFEFTEWKRIGLVFTSTFLYLNLFSQQNTAHNKDGDTLWFSNNHIISRNDGELCYVVIKKDSSNRADTTSEKINHFLPTNGFISYEYLYRSKLDTPFNQTDFQQHTLRAKVDVAILNQIPTTINLAYRVSNSPYFKNYLDVNVGFNPTAYKQSVINGISKRATNKLVSDFGLYKLEDRYNAKVKQVIEDQQNRTNPEFVQRQQYDVQNAKDLLMSEFSDSTNLFTREYFESAALEFVQGYIPDSVFCLVVKEFTGLPDSSIIKAVGKQSENIKTLKTNLHQSEKLETELKHLKDSISLIKYLIADSVNKVKSELASMNTIKDYKNWSKKNGRDSDSLEKNHFLMSLTNFNLGRTVINYSALTVNNISVTGLDAELRPGFIFKFSAGAIDYRYRDFISREMSRPKQAIVIGRVGLISKSGVSLFLTSYSGKRDIISGTANISGNLYNLSGYSIETKWNLNPYHTFSIELAKSTVPRFRVVNQNAKQLEGLLNFSQRSNEAYAIQYTGTIVSTSTKLSGSYRKFGSDFQSFSIYSFDANQSSWATTVDQSLFQKVLTVKLGIKKNEFLYPSITNLSTNTIFKTAQLSFHKRNWPACTIGYYPATQVVVLPDRELSAVTYHTVSITASHQYRLFGCESNTVALYSKFKNSLADSSFLYFNASYLSVQQLFWLNAFTLQAGYTKSEQQFAQLSTVESALDWHNRNGLQVGGGLKGNSLLGNTFKLTGNFRITSILKNIGTLQARYDRSYLPAWRERTLVPVTTGQIIFIRYF